MSARDREVQRFWKGMSLGALAPLLAAVFFSFTAIGFLVDVANRGAMQPRVLACVVVLSGLVAVAYALIGIRRRYWLFVPVVALQVLLPRWLERLWPPGAALEAEALQARLAADAIGVIAGLALGYGLFMVFIVGQGRRRVRADAEIELAREIHSSLVPEVRLAAADCEIYGRSIPASEVGGDLVDALVVDGRPFGVVADVSGHGVPAGMLLGLIKASLRTRLRSTVELSELLADLNDVLVEMTRPNTFATAALLALTAPTRVEFALAGHPPILHLRRRDGSVARLGDGGMALGIRAGEGYRSGQVAVGPGDVLAVLTDGFTETMDGEDGELGLAPIETALAAHAGLPLPELFDALLAVARAHGPQQDDRTLLLVGIRRASGEAKS